jgi:hypothetical protein
LTAALHRVEQVAVVQAVDQVRDDLGVGLAGEHVATGLQGRRAALRGFQ